MPRFTQTQLGMAMMAAGAIIACIASEAAANPFYVVGSGINTGVSYVTSPFTGYVCQNGSCRNVNYGLFPRPAYGPAPAVYYRPATPHYAPSYSTPNTIYSPGNGVYYTQPLPSAPVMNAPMQPPVWDAPQFRPLSGASGDNGDPFEQADPFYGANGAVAPPRMLPATPAARPLPQPAPMSIPNTSSPFYP